MSQKISSNLDRVEFRPLEKFQKGQKRSKYLKISQKISSNLDRVEYLDRVKFRPLAQQKNSSKNLKISQKISREIKKT